MYPSATLSPARSVGLGQTTSMTRPLELALTVLRPQNHSFTYDEPIKVESVTQAVCDLALRFGEGADEEEASMVRSLLAADALQLRAYHSTYSPGRSVLLFSLPATTRAVDLSCEFPFLRRTDLPSSLVHFFPATTPTLLEPSCATMPRLLVREVRVRRTSCRIRTTRCASLGARFRRLSDAHPSSLCSR